MVERTTEAPSTHENTHRPDAGPVASAYIDGGPVTGDRETIPVVNPAAPRTVVGYGAQSLPEDVDRATAAAAAAFPGWAQLTPRQRADAMLAGADAIAGDSAELVRQLVQEVGKPAHDCAGDVNGGVHLVRAFAALADELGQFEDLTGRPGTASADEVLLQQVPAGPAVIITPWNTPVYLCLNAVAPALIAGCSVVVKPPEAAPLALTRALHLLAAALPAGVLNVVPGSGAVVGDRLVRDPAVRSVSVTGGTATGRSVLKAAADTVKKVALELGGNDPAVVLADADLSTETLRELIAGSYSVSGQVCFNIKRIYIHESRYHEFVERFTALVDQLVIGPGDAPGVHLGPLTTEAGYRNAVRLMEHAQQSGHTVHIGGRWAEGFEPGDGWFVRPAVVTDLPADDELVMEEQFAPLIPVLPFSDEEAVITEANRTEYGLASSVWSGDRDHALAVARRIEAGNTFINAHRVGASVPLVPFGGVKQSGLGRNHLHHAVSEFTEEHAVIRYSDPHEQIPGISPWTALQETADARTTG
ncbi:aldehyde dehydrogenase family protein [Citricoccus sp. GCM10030269]|uniref:aldehyde dehydrogenase family protein n=1 Tax=Citricoccus sp. GCM10030269 TaxID=3273388 RepID=UPI003620A290